MSLRDSCFSVPGFPETSERVREASGTRSSRFRDFRKLRRGFGASLELVVLGSGVSGDFGEGSVSLRNS